MSVVLYKINKTMASVDLMEKNIKNEKKNIEKCYENYILIDIGSYLTHKKYMRDLDSVVQRAKDAGVQKIVVVGMSTNASKEGMRLTHLYPDYLYCTVGVHPHEARTWNDESFQDLLKFASSPECVAIGECGLDYNRDFSPHEIQKVAFEEQVKLACRLKKPLYLHERDAHDDMLEILRKYQKELPGGVIHCFTGEAEHAMAYLDIGLYIGITGYLCKDKSESGIRSLLQKGLLPLDRILVESDAPYMFANTQAAKLPVEVKQNLTERSLTYLNRYCTFQRNEPCSLPALVEIVAGLMGRKPEDIALTTAFNSLKLFALSK